MNEQDIVNKLKSDPRALKSVMQSQDGQALLRMLSGGNSAALGQAARQAASGDTAALSAMLSRVLSSPQGAELVQRLEQSSSSNGKEDAACQNWTKTQCAAVRSRQYGADHAAGAAALRLHGR